MNHASSQSEAPRILLVEDDRSIAQIMRLAFEEAGFVVDHACSIAQRDNLLSRGGYDVLVTDVVLEDGDGLSSISDVSQANDGLPVVVVSAQNTFDTAIRAERGAAFDYLPKPFDIDALVNAAKNAAASRNTAADTRPPTIDALELIGRSPAMQEVYRHIVRVLTNDLAVLITGESGTGKELVAQAIHRHGTRNGRPFVALNCAAIPKDLLESELFGHERGAFTGASHRNIGAFELASHGTLFLDEIGDMSIDAQSKVLRALEGGYIRRIGGRDDIPVDVRIIAATNQPIAKLIDAGAFREDLYYRINIIPIDLPALRDRGDDIALLTDHFLAEAAGAGLERRIFSTDARLLLDAHPWRGNVRELRNVVMRACALTREHKVSAHSLRLLLDTPSAHPAVDDPGDGFETAVVKWLERHTHGADLYGRALSALQKPLFRWALQQTQGNQLHTARKLGINRNTLRKHLVELGIDPARPISKTQIGSDNCR